MAARKKTRKVRKPARKGPARKGTARSKARKKPKAGKKSRRRRTARGEPEQMDSVQAIARSFALRHLR